MSPHASGRSVRAAATAATAVNLLATIVVWRALSGEQEVWPLPALYLLELVALPGAVAAVAFLRPTTLALFSLVAAGAAVAFSFLGVFSVGLLYAPGAVLLVAVAVLARSPGERSPYARVGLFAGGLVVQTALMLAGVRYL